MARVGPVCTRLDEKEEAPEPEDAGFARPAFIAEVGDGDMLLSRLWVVGENGKASECDDSIKSVGVMR